MLSKLATGRVARDPATAFWSVRVSQHLGSSVILGLAASPQLQAAAKVVRAHGAIDLVDLASAARPAVVAALWTNCGGQFVIWTPSVESADRFGNDCSSYLGDLGSPVATLRPRDERPGALVNPTERADRLTFLDDLRSGRPGIYCVPHASARQAYADPIAFGRAARRLTAGKEYPWEAMLASLSALGYERVEVVSAVGEYAVRGGLIDVFPATVEAPVRLEFFGDRLEQIRTFALSTQRSVDDRSDVGIVAWSEDALGTFDALLWDYAPAATVFIDDPEMLVAVDHGLAAQRDDTTVAAVDLPDQADDEADEDADGAPPASIEHQLFSMDEVSQGLGARGICALRSGIATAHLGRTADETVSLPCQPAPAFGRSIERFIEYVRKELASKAVIAVASVGHRRIAEVLQEHDLAPRAVPKRLQLPPQTAAVMAGEGMIDAGFVIPVLRLAVIGDNELYGHPARRQRRRAAKEGVPQSIADLSPGEFFVHAHHGIGQYLGLEHIIVDDVGRDFMQLAYAGEDRLYVPVDQMHLVRKYALADGSAPRLSKMGGSDWARTRGRVREAVERIAEGLVRLYAARELAVGHAFAPDSPWQSELEESFPYDETVDQAEAIRAVKDDMERARPMDRLVCGDVGYGKTEVAIRAAFKAVMDRKQVALLAPTTVLAAQHFRTFSERFAAYPVRIDLLSRFRSRAEQKATLLGLQSGGVDLVIGTHRLLQKDVGFKQLGLVVVDEEQRFGVMHKERLKELRQSVDVLTLSATPIPRTLHMGMAGVRDLSLIQTAPQNRMAIKTVVAPSSDALIESALAQELDRGGQIYFVHNRIETIYGVAAALAGLAPRARIAVGHGQMREGELEAVMLSFVNGEVDILVSTTIIENGLDIPNVNTIIINNADHFGLAQLYQLRGRVGRSAHQAYAYFLYQPHRVLSDVGQSRLEAIREFSHLGSGLQLAMRDLEIRGAGNLLGREQHGFIAAVGFETYCEILHEAVAQRRGQPLAPSVAPPVLDLRVSAFIPSDYVRGASQKISLYQRLAAAQSSGEVDALGDELRDRYGPLPAEAQSLLDLTHVRVLASAKGVQKVALEQRRLTLEMGPKFSLSEQALPILTSISGGNFRFTQGAIVVGLPDAGAGRLGTIREILSAL
jgi:transcription-repair coupling factor (superfamily II helicase)